MLINIFLQIIINTSGNNNLIAQGIGMIGLICAIISFQSNKRHIILIFLGIGQVSFIIHFALLGAWTASAMNMLGASRTFLFVLRGRKKWLENNTLLYVFIGLFVIAGIITWQNWLSLLPVLGMTIETIGLWMKNPTKIRFTVIVPRPLWLTYNTIYRSYAGMLTEAFVLVSILTGIIRFDILPWIRRKNV